MSRPGAPSVLLTGITGFVGSNLTHALLLRGRRVTALARAGQGGAVRERALGALAVAGELDGLPLDRLRVIEADITRDLGELLPKLDEVYDEVWHCAVVSKHGEHNREEIFAGNVDGTRHVLDLVARLPGDRPPPFYYTSTAYVCGKRGGTAEERLEDAPPEFHNLYEQSKFEAEHLVLAWSRERGADAVVLRPSVVVGHSATGRAVNYSGYYHVLRALDRLRRSLEANLRDDFDGDLDSRVLIAPGCTANLVPVDWVVEAMLAVAARRPQGFTVVHVTNEEPPGIELVLDVICADLRIRGIRLVDHAAVSMRDLDAAERTLHRSMGFQAPYLRLPGLRFSTERLRALVPHGILPPPRVTPDYLRLIDRVYLATLGQDRGPEIRT